MKIKTLTFRGDNSNYATPLEVSLPNDWTTAPYIVAAHWTGDKSAIESGLYNYTIARLFWTGMGATSAKFCYEKSGVFVSDGTEGAFIATNNEIVFDMENHKMYIGRGVSSRLLDYDAEWFATFIWL